MLKPLRIGSDGYLVTQWQTFLRGQGYPLDVTGLFDAATRQATEAFQAKYRLEVDGVVGNQTFGKAAMLGFEVVDTEHTAYPAKPSFAPLINTAERQKLFGPLEFVAAPTKNNPERLRITNDWEAKSLVRVTIPQLAHIPGGPANGVIQFHRKAAAQLKELWQAWDDAGLLPLVLSYEGAYNPRFVRGYAHQQRLSNHAFATAFDINYAWNKLGAEPATPTQRGCLYQLVPIAHQFGFYWGGHFTRKDGMHFEVAVIQS